MVSLKRRFVGFGLLALVSFLKTLDENIAFEECERSPATVLGVAASARTIGSVLSVLIAGFLFAFEGYNSSRQNGWEYGGDGVFAKDDG